MYVPSSSRGANVTTVTTTRTTTKAKKSISEDDDEKEGEDELVEDLEEGSMEDLLGMQPMTTKVTVPGTTNGPQEAGDTTTTTTTSTLLLVEELSIAKDWVYDPETDIIPTRIRWVNPRLGRRTLR